MPTLSCNSGGLVAMLLLVRVVLLPLVAAVSSQNCYMGGSGGWDVVWWGEPNPRLPNGGPAIPLCTGTGVVNLLWRHDAGVFQLPSATCPGSFMEPFNDTYKDLAAVSSHGKYSFTPPPVVGSYYLTSQVPGACEAGILVQVDVIGRRSGSTRIAVSLTAALAAALLLVVCLGLL